MAMKVETTTQTNTGGDVGRNPNHTFSWTDGRREQQDDEVTLAPGCLTVFFYSKVMWLREVLTHFLNAGTIIPNVPIVISTSRPQDDLNL